MDFSGSERAESGLCDRRHPPHSQSPFHEAVACVRGAINIVAAERLKDGQTLDFPTAVEVGEISLAPRPEFVEQARERWFRKPI